MCKADDPYSFNNYRSVSLLRVLSMVFERVMYNSLVEYLEMLNILKNKQFGFRKFHSSYMALMVLTHHGPVTQYCGGSILCKKFFTF